MSRKAVTLQYHRIRLAREELVRGDRNGMGLEGEYVRGYGYLSRKEENEKVEYVKGASPNAEYV